MAEGEAIKELSEVISIVDYKDMNYLLYFETGIFIIGFLIGVMIGLAFWKLCFNRLG